MKSKTPEQLFALFWETARKAQFADRPTGYNRLIDRMDMISDEMERRSPDARRLLVSLLKDKSETVRYAAAASLLEVAEQEAVAVLEDLVEHGKSDAGGFAQLNLMRWREKKAAPD